MRPSALPAFVTCANLVAGFLALLLAIGGEFWWAAALVSGAGVLDLLDGAIARRNSTEDEFGSNLDSLADLVSFGVAPAVALYLSFLNGLPVLGAAGCIFYVVCGALRLARFPLVRNRYNFVGLPIPPAGILISCVAAASPPALPAIVLTFAVGTLMVSEIPFPKGPGSIPLGRKASKGSEADASSSGSS
ncbi:MAG: CDP-diacylglycerol--serine O-phosphatidyltransferase [Rubrobacteraceae bacterium]